MERFRQVFRKYYVYPSSKLDKYNALLYVFSAKHVWSITLI